MDVDCRTCAYYTTQTGGCTSVVQCVDAMRYQPTAPRRYWLLSAAANSGFDTLPDDYEAGHVP
jgi:hypothetical protein